MGNMMQIEAPQEKLVIPGRDGTPLMVWRFGNGPICLLLAPGLGTPVISWKYNCRAIPSEFHHHHWDARGITNPAPGGPGSIADRGSHRRFICDRGVF
jgi:hypothetical protein